MNELDRLGPRLRAARQRKGWTLDDLAGRTNISVSTLSRLETGRRQASLEVLIPLARQLGVRIDELLAPEPADPRVRRPAVRRDGYVYAPLTLEGSPVQALKVTYPPVAEPPTLKVHDGFEWLYVLSGKLLLQLDGDEHVLTRGEAAEFDTRTPHAMSAHGSRPAEVLSIFDGTGERMHTHSLS